MYWALTRLTSFFPSAKDLGDGRSRYPPSAGQYPLKEPQVPVPVSGLNPSGLWMTWCRVPCGSSLARYIIIPPPFFPNWVLEKVKRQDLTPEPLQEIIFKDLRYLIDKKLCPG
jgi:hypothetical protein